MYEKWTYFPKDKKESTKDNFAQIEDFPIWVLFYRKNQIKYLLKDKIKVAK